MVTYSTKYFKLADAETSSLMPDTETPMSSGDFFNGRDPALDALMNGEPETTNLSGFLLPLIGGLSQSADNGGNQASSGHATLVSTDDGPVPAGLAILTARRNGITVSEASVPAAAASLSGRSYVEMHGAVKTGIAFANPFESPVEISFYFTDSSGANLKQGAMILPARSQIARYLDQEPFNGDSTFEGTFTWTSRKPIGAMALREIITGDRELMTTLPIHDQATPVNQMLILPHFADGGGGNTQVVLVNPPANILSRSLRFFGRANGSETAAPVEVVINGVKASNFPYELPPRAARRFLTDGSPVEVQSGSIRIIPAASGTSPSASGIFMFESGGELISTAGVTAMAPVSQFQIYAEASGGFESADPGSNMTGLAICNVSDKPLAANLTLRNLNGHVAKHSSVTLAPQGQLALFLNQIPGFDALLRPFQGSLVVEAESGAIAVTGIRAKFNEKGDFLISATPPVGDSDPGKIRLFPQLAVGNGYSTQVVLLSTAARGNLAGWIQFLTPAGMPWSLLLR